ncbi:MULTISPECIES: cobyric acid synthase [Bacillus]|uniref:cobyric acid synthase n=1 Tax=Bacillus TaxID=1386 RepID=UPI0002E5BDC9|nr:MULTISPECIES: cobyric acid synthase [Bacillus]
MEIVRGKAKPIMVQGTHSDSGKSIFVTALCKIFSEDGLKVAPFKSQNMALNSYITNDGLEIGRAQGIQAEAAGVDASVHMNPILIKPSGDMKSQVVLHGKPYSDMKAAVYRQNFFETGLQAISESFKKLADEYDCIVIEGAGSPAEINLNDRELVNMRLARLVDSPVILVGDIDRGGVFASLVGTLQLLSEEDRKRVKGVIINKFRGDVTLLQPGLDWFEEYTSVPVLGVIPYIPNLEIDGEDSLSLAQYSIRGTNDEADIDIAVIAHPTFSNFTDLDPLRLEKDCNVRFVKKTSQLGNPDVIIIPGTKNSAYAMEFMKETGLDRKILSLVKKGTYIFGICGGYQLLGKELLDEYQVESDITKILGLGLLPIVTEMKQDKKTVITNGFTKCFGEEMIPLKGYEVHMGISKTTEYVPCFAFLNGEEEGCCMNNGKIIGTYLHHIFHNNEFRGVFLNQVRATIGLPSIERTLDVEVLKENEYRRLANHVRQNVDIEKIYEILHR